MDEQIFFKGLEIRVMYWDTWMGQVETVEYFRRLLGEVTQANYLRFCLKHYSSVNVARVEPTAAEKNKGLDKFSVKTLAHITFRPCTIYRVKYT